MFKLVPLLPRKLPHCQLQSGLRCLNILVSHPSVRGSIDTTVVQSTKSQHILARQPKEMKLCNPIMRYYSKGKSKGGSKQATAHITDSELENIINLKSFKDESNSVLSNLQENFLQNLSIRTNLGSIESLSVELEGDKYSLSELCNVVRKSPTLLLVDCTAFPQAVTNVKKAILESGMNLNPQQEGTTLYIPIQKVTKEHREGLAKNAKQLCDKAKNNLKDIQNNYVKKLRHKEGDISQDTLFNAQLKIREMTKDFCHSADEMTKKKTGELLKV